LAEKIKAAISALPNSSGIVKIASGTYSVTSGSIVIPSNVTVVCDPGLSTVIEIGSSTFDIPLISITNATNFALKNCIIDGNRSADTNLFSMIQVSGSSYGTFSGNVIRNSYGNGMFLSAETLKSVLQQRTIQERPATLPRPPLCTQKNEAGGHRLRRPGSANTFIRIDGNKVHDNNTELKFNPV